MTTAVFLLVLLGALLNAGWNITVGGYRNQRAFVWSVGVWSGIWPLVFIPFVYAHLNWEWGTLLLGLSSGFFLSIYYFFLEKAYKTGEISLVYPLIRSSPLWVAMIGVLFLGEQMSLLAWLGLLMTLAGVSILPLALRQGKSTNLRQQILENSSKWAPLLALLASLGTTAYSLSDKLAMDFYSAAPMAGVALASISSTSKLFFWGIISPKAREGFTWSKLTADGVPLWITASCGFAVFAAYTIIICAFQYADAGRVMAVYNVSIIIVAIVGILFFNERVGLKVRLAGIALTVIGVTFLRLF